MQNNNLYICYHNNSKYSSSKEKIILKVGVLVLFDSVDTIEEKFINLTNNNFDNCQLNVWDQSLMTDDNVELIKNLAQKYNITISAMWCGWEGPQVWDFYDGPKTLGLLPSEYREIRIANLKNGLDFAKKLGLKDVATHMGFIPENPYDPEFIPLCNAIKAVAEHAKGNGQYILFETGQETPVAMLRCFEQIGLDNLGVNLDTANLILYGKANPVDALDIIGKYVRNMHAKDGVYPTDGHSLGKETRIGDGKVDFEAVIKKLHQLGYNGYVTIEREISGEQQNTDILYAREYLNKIISDVCGG